MDPICNGCQDPCEQFYALPCGDSFCLQCVLDHIQVAKERAITNEKGYCSKCNEIIYPNYIPVAIPFSDTIEKACQVIKELDKWYDQLVEEQYKYNKIMSNILNKYEPIQKIIDEEYKIYPHYDSWVLWAKKMLLINPENASVISTMMTTRKSIPYTSIIKNIYENDIEQEIHFLPEKWIYIYLQDNKLCLTTDYSNVFSKKKYIDSPYKIYKQLLDEKSGACMVILAKNIYLAHLYDKKISIIKEVTKFDNFVMIDSSSGYFLKRTVNNMIIYHWTLPNTFNEIYTINYNTIKWDEQLNKLYFIGNFIILCTESYIITINIKNHTHKIRKYNFVAYYEEDDIINHSFVYLSNDLIPYLIIYFQNLFFDKIAIRCRSLEI